MSGRGFCIKVEINLHAITCPGVWLCPNGKVALRINTLKSCIDSHRISPIFPLLFHDKFIFKMVFNGVTSLGALQRSLENEFFYAELLQWTENATGFVILSTFEANLADLLYPSSSLKGLLAGVDVDLLMEPTKFFPGILAPKIEVSTKTMVEEIVGICDSNATGAFVINPKVIHSKNVSNIKRKQPTKGIIRQRKVCHSKGKVKYQPCRSCKKTRKLQVASSPVSSDRYTESPSECYHKELKISNCSCAPSQKNSIDRESHKFENCPVCSKYNCYFSENSYENEDTCGNKYENKKKINSSPKTHEAINSHLEKENYCACGPKSAPPSKDPANSILRDRIHQLQKAKEKFSYTNDFCLADSACVCDPSHDYCDHKRPVFYKNLEKFYKRMYKQAKLRAEQIDCY